MSSSRVSVVPMTGSPGETMVNVYPLAINNTHRTLATTARVSDGQDYQTVTIYHYGVPTAYPQGGGSNLNFVSTGETKAVTVYSPSRDFKFSFTGGQWLTDIYDSAGYIYQFDTKIDMRRSTNTFYFTAAANNGPARSGNLIFEFYDSTFITHSATTTIPINQAAGGVAPYLSVSPATLYMDYDSAQTRSISVASNMPSWTFTNTEPGKWKTSATTTSNSGEIKVTNRIHNQWRLTGEWSNLYGQVDVDGVSAGTHYSGSVQVVQFYEPTLQLQAGGNIFFASGGTGQMWANTPYDWWLTAPDWITFRYNGSPFNPTESNRMTATTTGGMAFNAIVAENTGPEREGNIYLHFQRNDGQYNSTLAIKITQRTGEEEYVTFHDQWNENINKITFPYSANTGIARLLIVSANTRWETSWATGGLFDLPYAETGASGGTMVQINYEGLQDPDSAVTDTLIFTTRGGRNFELMVKKPKKPTIYLWHDTYEVPSTGGTKYFMVDCDYPYWITPQPMPSYIHWYDYDGNPLSGNSSNPNPGAPNGAVMVYATWDAIPSGEGTRRDTFNMYYNPAHDVAESVSKYGFAQFTQISENAPDYVVITPDVGYFSPDAVSGDTITFTISAGTSYSITFPSHMYNWDKFTVSPANASPGLTTVTVTYIGEYAPNTQYRTILGGYKTSDGSSWGSVNIYKPAAD